MNLWQTISNWGTSGSDSKRAVRSIRLNNQIAFLATVTTFAFVPHIYLIGGQHYAPFQLIAGILCLLYLPLNNFRFFKTSMYWIVFVIGTNVFFVSLELPNMGGEYFFIPLFLVPLVAFERLQEAVLPSLFALVLFFVQKWMEQSYAPAATFSPFATIATFCMVLSSVFILCGVFILQFKAAHRKYEGIITDQMKVIEAKNNDITDSIRYAKRIQNAQLPPVSMVKNCFSDAFVLYLPKDIVAGDFYWLEKLENRCFIAVADCTGHGVPGAMVSVTCSAALSKAVKELHLLRPSDILDKVSVLVEEQFAKSDEEIKDGMDTAMCCIDTDNLVLEFAGANNPLYLVRNNELKEIKADKQPVGKHTGRVPFTNHRMDLQSGDVLYLFSDGFADQFGGPRGKKFKYAPFKKLLLDHHQKPMGIQQQLFHETIADWQGALEQVDDICLIGVRI